VYVMSWTLEEPITRALVRHFGTDPFTVLGPPFEPVLKGAAVIAAFWLVLLWMYRRRIFLKI
jgi:heparan-alpha-glucosaminide N-acetyltransferase